MNEVTKFGASSELMSQVMAASNLEAGVRAQSGTNLTWLTLVDGASNILVKGEPQYIEGAKMHDYVIGSKKLCLGPNPRVIVLGMLKVYAEVEPAKVKGEMSKTVGYWHPADAEQVPLEGYFDRPLSNGHVLQPVHWVFLYLRDHPELEGVVVSFRSTGNKIYAALEKLVKAESRIVPELAFTLGNQGIKAESYNRTYFYPKFDLEAQRNFAFDPEKGVSLVEGGLGADELETVLKRYSELYKAYNEGILVARRTNVGSYIPGAPAKAALDAPLDATAGNDGEDVRF